MKAISLWQPWASAIAIGAKRIETRSWSTSYRGPLAIHAASRMPDLDAMLFDYWCAVFDTGAPYAHALLLPRGAVVATCTLIDCIPTERVDATMVRSTGSGEFGEFVEMQLGDYTPGRFAWLLTDIKPLAEPLRRRGRQRLFTVTIPTAQGGH